ncbi:MAG: hypothetical protein L6Q35_16080 [Phycisphaerales bacterium]|nr:hypothetical protein [Phycisphaerales bacterium]
MNASNRMLIVTIACAPAIAGAHIVHFTNPAPGQPGHFDWHAPSGGDLMFLDITAAPTDQIDQWSLSTIGQTASGLPLTTNFAGGAALAVATIDEPFVLALEHGQSFHDRVFIDNGMSSAFLTTPPGTRFEAGERRYIGVLTADGRYGWIEVSRDGPVSRRSRGRTRPRRASRSPQARCPRRVGCLSPSSHAPPFSEGDVRESSPDHDGRGDDDRSLRRRLHRPRAAQPGRARRFAS